MPYLFLSDEWFDEVASIRQAAGAIEIPKKLVGFILNLTVKGGPEGDKEIHFTEGTFKKGHHPDSPTTLTLPFDLCIQALLENDTKAAMKGFLTRKIRIKGDLTQMLVLASIKAEGDFDKLRSDTLAATLKR